MTWRLLPQSGPLAGKRYPLKKDLISVGRHDSNDCTLPYAGVSRRHAEIRHQGGEWLIVDLESTNGTFVNGVRIPAYEPHPLRDGDRIRLGRAEILVAESAALRRVPPDQPPIEPERKPRPERPPERKPAPPPKPYRRLIFRVSRPLTGLEQQELASLLTKLGSTLEGMVEDALGDDYPALDRQKIAAGTLAVLGSGDATPAHLRSDHDLLRRAVNQSLSTLSTTGRLSKRGAPRR
jgi:pSer/pThr/pTyr-binding forkhead associated (FHA) protein